MTIYLNEANESSGYAQFEAKFEKLCLWVRGKKEKEEKGGKD